MPATLNGTCSECAKPIHLSPSSRLEPTCHACRREARHKPCAGCGKRFEARLKRTVFCSITCANGSRRRLSEQEKEDSFSQRRYREQDAPGLTQRGREILRHKWRKQGRKCYYCGKANPTDADHVIPLSRGGTNWEGNLVPCCRPCNGSKGHRFLMEWRTNRPAPPKHKQRTTPKPKPVKKAKPTLTPHQCRVCGATALITVSKSGQKRRRWYCSDDCMLEHNRRSNRDRYRLSNGIPTDSAWPTQCFTKSVHQGHAEIL
jgi:hypothetical protein